MDQRGKILIYENHLRLERINGQYKLSKLNQNTWSFIWLTKDEAVMLLTNLHIDLFHYLNGTHNDE